MGSDLVYFPLEESSSKPDRRSVRRILSEEANTLTQACNGAFRLGFRLAGNRVTPPGNGVPDDYSYRAGYAKGLLTDWSDGDNPRQFRNSEPRRTISRDFAKRLVQEALQDAVLQGLRRGFEWRNKLEASKESQQRE